MVKNLQEICNVDNVYGCVELKIEAWQSYYFFFRFIAIFNIKHLCCEN